MKPHHYLALFIRIIAIVIFAYGIRQSSLFFQVLINGNLHGAEFPLFFALATSLIPLALAILFWKFPLTISKAIISPEYDNNLEPMNHESTLSILILAIGLFFMLYALSDTIYWAVYTQLTAGHQLDPEVKSNIITTGAELLISFILIGKAKTIAKQLIKVSK